MELRDGPIRADTANHGGNWNVSCTKFGPWRDAYSNKAPPQKLSHGLSGTERLYEL
jgi:hypothetical protein